MKNQIFDKLFIFEMANNHMGDVSHGIQIINAFHKVSRNYPFHFAFKFQYRHLDSFIHPDYRGRQDIKYIKRFSETRLAEDEFQRLKALMVTLGFISVCTPFDETSVDLIEKHGFDIIKIASCSFTDWPLLERIAKTDKPIVASTAGASLEEIDNVVMFFEHRNKDLCLMHCVGAYPTPADALELNQIDLFKARYAGIPIGYSTHEEPDNVDAVKIAIGKGARVFERHVGVDAGNYPLNAYSSSPAQIDRWLNAAQEAYRMCGVVGRRRDFPEKEIVDLLGLRRGAFCTHDTPPRTALDPEKVFFAIPSQPGQLLANDFSKYREYRTTTTCLRHAPLLIKDLECSDLRQQIVHIIKDLKALILKGGIKVKDKLELELSHHYGVDDFYRHGCSIINCINREYCKKIILLLPGQENPPHFHKQKEETFNVLYGDLRITLGGKSAVYEAGDLVTVERGMTHSFSSEHGAIFEEVSTTHFKNDSFYEDSVIMDTPNRKTTMTFWADWLEKDIR